MTQPPDSAAPEPRYARDRADTPGATQESAPPPYDPVSVGRVARGVQIRGIELVAANFTRGDAGALPLVSQTQVEPDLGMDVQYGLSENGDQLGCLLTFATLFTEPEPYRLTAQFRLLYDVVLPERPSDADLHQFANWNAVFNAWPYWREYLSSTLNRARLAPFLVPVMAVPFPKETASEPQAPSEAPTSEGPDA